MKRSSDNDKYENFVRKNLRKRFKGYKKRPKKSLDHQSIDLNNNFENYSDSDNSSTDNKILTNKENTSMSKANTLGLDPLQLSLNAFTFYQNKNIPNRFENSNRQESFTEFFDDKMNNELKGDSFEVKKGTGKPLEENFRNSDSNQAISGLSRNKYEMNISLMEKLAPNCCGHSIPAKLLTVKKQGNNKVILIKFKTLEYIVIFNLLRLFD